MEKLYELHQRTDFDLVVVDTPPTRNALDFIDAPAAAVPLPRPPPVPHGHRARPRRDEGGERGRADVPAHGRQGGGRRGDRRRHRVLPGLRGDGGGLPRAGRRRARAARRPTRRRSCSSPRRGATRSRRRSSSPPSSPRPTSPVRALIVNRMHPTLRQGPGRGGAGAGRDARRAPTSAGSTATWPTSSSSASREEHHLAGLAERGRAGAGRARAVPADRRPRHRRPHRPRRDAVTCSSTLAAPRAATARGLGVGERRGRVVDRLGDRNDAVEAGGVQQAGEGGAAARDGDVAARLAGAADAADERAETGRVHERHGGEVDEQVLLAGEAAEGLPELAHRVGVELTDGPAERVVGGFLHLDVEHSSSRGRWFGVPQG